MNVEREIFGTKLIEYLPGVGALLVTFGYLGLAYTYKADARAFPAGVAWVMAVLTVLDLLARSRTGIGAAVARALNPDAHVHAPGNYTAWRQVSAVLWIWGFALSLYLVGIMIAVPAYTFASVRFRGKRGYLTSIAVSGLTTLVIWLLFAKLLRIILYPGLFLAP